MSALKNELFTKEQLSAIQNPKTMNLEMFLQCLGACMDDLDQYYLLLSMFPKMNEGFKNWADDWDKHCALFRSENM